MVIKESMRLYPAVWGIGRRAIASCEIGGYRVAAGTNIFIFQSLTQRDARFFSDPDKFDPERWREDPVRGEKFRGLLIFRLEAVREFAWELPSRCWRPRCCLP